MSFNAKDAKDLADEFAETRFPRSYMAAILGVPNFYITQYVKGIKQPSDDLVRKMRAVFAMIRTAHMESGGFKLDKANMDLLRKKLAAMEKSIVKRQPAAEGRRKCAATVN